jgi:hypothetical protein
MVKITAADCRAIIRDFLVQKLENGCVFYPGVIDAAFFAASRQSNREAWCAVVMETFEQMQICDHRGWSGDAI